MEKVEIITIPKAELFTEMRQFFAAELAELRQLAEVLSAQSLSPSEAAKYLGVTPATVRNWTTAGKLKKNELNGYNLADLAELKTARKWTI